VESAHAADATTNTGANQAEPGSEVIAVDVAGGTLAVELVRSRTEPVLAVRPVDGVDHAASIMSRAGARASAALIAEALS
jgi:hypothetical protein